jgi:hypothetical protein
MVSITQHMAGRRNTIERRIYKDETGREFVRVNGMWFSLDHYFLDDHYEVYRY